MSVTRRVNFLSEQRVDLPDLRSIESANSADFDSLIQSVITGTVQPYVLRGFTINMTAAVGGAASALQLIVDPGALLHITATQSGTFYLVPSGTAPQVLNSATNNIVDGAFTPNAINYISLDYERYADDTTAAQTYFWDPSQNTETTKVTPRAVILRYRIKISTASPAATYLPIAVVTTDSSNNVTQVTDARWLLFRLGTGGSTPNPFYTYPWSQGRSENPSSSSSNTSDPFYGGDKAIANLKEWMNAVMSALQDIKGTTYWYSVSSSGSTASLREDLGNTVTTGAGVISHGVLPNASPVLSTTGDITTDSNQLTNLSSVTNLANGQFIFGTGIPYGTTVLSFVGNTVTMSQKATATSSGVGVSFYAANVITSPGQVNWDQDIYFRVIGSNISYILSPNPSSGNIILGDDDVAYVTLVRNAAITPNLIFTNGSNVVTSVGSVSWTSNLQSGDWVKLASDTSSGYYEIDTVDSLTQVTLLTPFGGTSTGAAGAKSQYAFGSYTNSVTPSTLRDIYIAPRGEVPQGQDVFWLFLREDSGGTVPRVYIRFLGVELEQGETNNIDDSVATQLLKYIGSPMESASQPQYVSALNPGSVPQIQTLTFDTAAAIAQNSYFTINSAGNARQYYVWFNKDAGGTDPAPGFKNASIEVAITTGMTDAQVAAAVNTAFNSTLDFSSVQSISPTNEIVVTNTSAGVTAAAADVNVGGAFSVTVDQTGTGVGNNVISDGDNLTLAIKKLDTIIGAFNAALDEPSYDEPLDIVAPISSGANVTLPLNTRLANIQQMYTVGKGVLQVFLNGQYLRLGDDWLEVGTAGTASQEIELGQSLVIGDILEFRMSGIGSGSGGTGGGGQGPAGPAGPAGPPGANAAGGPIAISTKIADYSVSLSDCFLKADNSVNSANITFTLPSAASASGRIFYFKKIDAAAFAMIIQTTGGELIDGFTSQSTSTQYDAFSLISDGTTWSIF